MAFKSYQTMNGQLIGESGPEGTVDYQLDGLGSVIGTWRSTGSLQNQYRYSGYGQLVHKSGTGADPYFLWVGGWGYRTRGMVYVRRRVFYEDAALWTSVDPLWPGESAYGYAACRPTLFIDSRGMYIETTWDSPCGTKPQQCCDDLMRVAYDSARRNVFTKCMRDHGHGEYIDAVLDQWRAACRGLDKKVCVFCNDPSSAHNDVPPECPKPCGPMGNMPANIMGQNIFSDAWPYSPVPASSGCTPIITDPNECRAKIRSLGCKCAITLCSDVSRTESGSAGSPIMHVGFCTTMAHELVHCTGLGHSKGNSDHDVVNVAGYCFCRAMYGLTDFRCNSHDPNREPILK